MKLNLVLATVFMASTLLPATGQAAGGVCPCWTTEILQSIQGGAWCNKVGWHDGQNGEDVSLN
ncbi:hypothetical protein OEG84_02905 [Hoeflea sp. G2-23]|uniref:Uncharacterized protein n=1 Tax=Hoeflea algicola TaxID=2983763 RepID=A0ABT3Z5W1_9HYPH|nr:hypothetical protein [Hoeflea algicola]MCY0146691.1 hypothetical protein [Hoeflea algicola]